MKQLYEERMIRQSKEVGIGLKNSSDITLEEIYGAMDEVRRDW